MISSSSTKEPKIAFSVDIPLELHECVTILEIAPRSEKLISMMCCLLKDIGNKGNKGWYIKTMGPRYEYEFELLDMRDDVICGAYRMISPFDVGTFEIMIDATSDKNTLLPRKRKRRSESCSVM